MKIMLFVLFISLSLTSNAQDSTATKKPQTKLEELSLQEGSIIKKEFSQLGIIRGVEVSFLVVTDVTNNITQKGLRFSSTSGLYRSNTAFLDADEINGLIKFLDFTKTLKDRPETYTEFNYNSKGDFKAFAYGDKRYDWKIGFYVDRFYSQTQIEMKERDLDNLFQYANSVKDKL